MVKKPIMTFNDSWPWALLMTFVLGASVQAIRYAEAHGFDKTGFLVLGITVAVFVAITVLRYILRGIQIEAWNNAYQTKLGTAIMPNGVTGVSYANVEKVVDDAIVYWAAWAPANIGISIKSATALMTTAFSGATIAISPKIIVAGNQSWSGKFLGIQEDQNIYVVYDKKIVADETTFLGLLRHEVSHLCLTALAVDPGVGGSNQHAIFAKTGYC